MRFLARSIAAALTAAVTLTSLDLAPAYAAASKDQKTIQKTSTDFSARRRRHYGNRAALGAMIGMFGTIAAIAAANEYRDRYYYYGDSYYGGPYPYYGGGPYYGGPFYGYGWGGGYRHYGGGYHHHHHRR